MAIHHSEGIYCMNTWWCLIQLQTNIWWHIRKTCIVNFVVTNLFWEACHLWLELLIHLLIVLWINLLLCLYIVKMPIIITPSLRWCLLFVSDQQSKTLRYSVYYHTSKQSSKSSHWTGWNQSIWGIFGKMTNDDKKKYISADQMEVIQ